MQWHLDAQALFEAKQLEANQQGLQAMNAHVITAMEEHKYVPQ